MQLRVDDVTWRKVEDDVILLDLRNSKYLHLNATGALLWNRLVDGDDETGLVDALVEKCGAQRSRAADDVHAFIGQLRSSGLIS